MTFLPVCPCHQLNARDTETSKLSADNERLGLELGRARGEIQKQQVQLQELESMRQELAVTYEDNTQLRDRVSVAQQELAKVKAEAAARTPVHTTVQQVCQHSLGHSLSAMFACWLLASTAGVAATCML